MNIDFAPNGTARCLYTELLPLADFGRLAVSRASNIEFNEADQKWEVLDLDGKVLFRDPSRAACLKWEEQNLF